MNYGLREIDTAFKNMLQEMYEGYKIVHHNPDIDWVNESYPCIAFKSEQNGRGACKDFNSYDIDDHYITEKPDYTQVVITLYLYARKQQDINDMIEIWLNTHGTYVSTLDITGKDGNTITTYLEGMTAFITSDEKLQGKTLYRRVLQLNLDVPVEHQPKEYQKINKIIIKEVDM